jgi:phosphonate transport system permease protein
MNLLFLNPQGWPQLWRFIQAALHPSLQPDLWRIILAAMGTTLAYAIAGTGLSVIIGLVFGVLSSQVWWAAWGSGQARSIYPVIRFALSIPRAIHEMIWGLLLVNIWGLDPLTGIVAIAIPFGAITAKVFAEILDDTPRQPLMALLNSGVKPLPAFLYGLFPQAFNDWVSYGFYRFECSLRSATVLGIIGAGGLGTQILISLQGLKYTELWTFFYVLMLLNGGVDWASRKLRQGLDQRRLSAWPIIGGGLIATVWAWFYLRADWSRVTDARSRRLAQDFVRQLWPWDFSSIGQLGQPMLDTVFMAIGAMLIAAIGGFGLALCVTRSPFNQVHHSTHPFSSIPGIFTRSLLLLCRTIPAPIWALVCLYVLFPGILPGAIALGIHNLGIMGRLMTEVIENLDRRPLLALKTTGASPSGIALYGILPLAAPRWIGYSLYRWEVCMRETVVVGLVGAGGLGRILIEQLTSFDYRAVMVTLTGFVVLTLGVDWVSGQLRQRRR